MTIIETVFDKNTLEYDNWFENKIKQFDFARAENALKNCLVKNIVEKNKSCLKEKTTLYIFENSFRLTKNIMLTIVCCADCIL